MNTRLEIGDLIFHGGEYKMVYFIGGKEARTIQKDGKTNAVELRQNPIIVKSRHGKDGLENFLANHGLTVSVNS